MKLEFLGARGLGAAGFSEGRVGVSREMTFVSCSGREGDWVGEDEALGRPQEFAGAGRVGVDCSVRGEMGRARKRLLGEAREGSWWVWESKLEGGAGRAGWGGGVVVGGVGAWGVGRGGAGGWGGGRARVVCGA